MIHIDIVLVCTFVCKYGYKVLRQIDYIVLSFGFVAYLFMLFCMGKLKFYLILQDPQVVTGSHDSTIKFWDLRYGNLCF